MYQLKNKSIVFGILTMFFCLAVSPTLSSLNTATTSQENINEKIGYQQQSGYTLDSAPYQIQSLMVRLFNLKDTFTDINDIKNWLMNNTENPIIILFLSRLLTMNQLENKEIILSIGWTYNLNPFKKMEMKLIKPLTIWMYTNSVGLFDIPSSTMIISGDPINIELVSGNQIGYMYKFHGIYGHVPNTIPDKSFTFMIGYAQNIGAFDLPEIG